MTESALVGASVEATVGIETIDSSMFVRTLLQCQVPCLRPHR